MQWISQTAGQMTVDVGQAAREHYDSVFRFCARRVGVDLAADAAQETFLTAHRVAWKFRGDSSVTTWLFGIANNECRRLIRKRNLQAPTLEFDPDIPQGSGETQIVDRHSLREALARLSVDHREVVLLHEIEGLTYEEAAKVLEVPVGTVKSRLHHAFLALRKTLTANGGDEK